MAFLFRALGVLTFGLNTYVALASPEAWGDIRTAYPIILGFVLAFGCFGIGELYDRQRYTMRYMRWLKAQIGKAKASEDEPRRAASDYLPIEPPRQAPTPNTERRAGWWVKENPIPRELPIEPGSYDDRLQEYQKPQPPTPEPPTA